MNEQMNKWQWMNERTTEWINKWMNEQMNTWMNKRLNEWINEQLNEQLNEWMNEWMNVCMWLFRMLFMVHLIVRHQNLSDWEDHERRMERAHTSDSLLTENPVNITVTQALFQRKQNIKHILEGFCPNSSQYESMNMNINMKVHIQLYNRVIISFWICCKSETEFKNWLIRCLHSDQIWTTDNDFLIYKVSFHPIWKCM